MALIIEDGTVITSANSFATDAEFVAYAALRNITIPSTEAERDVLQLKAVDFIIANEYKLQGSRVNSDQELPFPRYGVSLHGFYLASDKIPSTLKKAQFEAAILSQTIDLLPSSQLQNIETEKLDTLEKSYFKGGKAIRIDARSVFTYLAPLLSNNNKLVRT